MIIDLHFHTRQYSPCSRIDIEEGIKYAKEMGLDGICITDHDTKGAHKLAKDLAKKYDILVIVGVEIFTHEGDILCFGLDEVPKDKIHAQQLVDLVNEKEGVTIGAHPFRNNGRGLGDHINNLKGLTAVEIFNGNTLYENNLKAGILASRLNLPSTGASDAHRLENIGIYATKFFDSIKDERDLINAVKNRKMTPVYYDSKIKEFKEFEENNSGILSQASL